MSKNYKIKKQVSEPIEPAKETLSKKEQYDLQKAKKEQQKKKITGKKKKQSKKTYQTNLAGRIFAIIMLILMVGSVIASIAAYIK